MIKQKDEVTLVDLDNNVLGKLDKYEAHKHPAKLHRAVSVWLINSKGEILLQKRSEKKIVGAGWWANAICGNVYPKELFFNCAVRRLKEEIGLINVDIKPLYKFGYQAYCNDQYGEHELDQVYIGKYEGKVIPNPDEVSEYTWINLDDFISQLQLIENIPAPEQTLLMSLEDLKQNIHPIEININGSKQIVTPWTAMMIRDERLIKALKQLLLA